MYSESDSHAGVPRHIACNTLIHPRILRGHTINPQRAIGQYMKRGVVFEVREDVLAVIGPRDLRGGSAGDFTRHQDWVVYDDCVLVVWQRHLWRHWTHTHTHTHTRVCVKSSLSVKRFYLWGKYVYHILNVFNSLNDVFWVF